MAVEIHDLASAAERAKVTPEIVRRWISEGLQATPVGRAGTEEGRDFRILDSWLVAYLEERAEKDFEEKLQQAKEENRKARADLAAARIRERLEKRRGRAAKPAPFARQPQKRKQPEKPAPSGWRADLERWKSMAKDDGSA